MAKLVSRSTAAAAVVVLAAGWGCTYSENDIYECKVEERPLEDDAQPSPVFGFAPAEVMSWAHGSHLGGARWSPPAAGTTTNVSGETALSIEIERGSGSAVELIGEPGCTETRMRIPVELAVRTDDGALHEQLTGSLYATRADFARIEADVDFADLEGSLAYRTDDAALRFVSPTLSAVLSRDGHAGSISAGLERRQGDGVSLSPLQPLLVWPAQSACGSDEVARAATPDWAIPVENASIAVWRGPEALDGGLFASVEVGLTGEVCEAESGETTAPANVRVQYASSNTDVTFPARFARVDDRFELELLSEARMGGAPADFVARFGDFGASLMHFEHVQLEMELTFYPKSAMVVHDTRGVLSVVGFEDTCKRMCNATMCNGCGPLEPQVVFSVGLDGRF